MSREREMVRIHETEYERGSSCAEGALENFREVSLGLGLSNDLQGETLLGRKNEQEVHYTTLSA